MDDAIITANELELLKADKSELRKRLEMEALGEIHYCQGMTIRKDRNSKVMMIHQRISFEAVLKKFGI